MIWKYFEPKFEYEEKFADSDWPWAGHKHFAYDLIANIKPKRIVELGTHYGTSLWSFAQAVKDQQIDTEIDAIDTWKGDDQAGFYDESVFEKVNEIKSAYYGNLNMNLIRKTFDEAIFDFKDNSIDILHIDGLHTYEAVKHDFENWLPKLNQNGVILFHDIKVAENDFGVYKLWDELKEKYLTLEFFHSFGLGILFLNKNSGEEIKNKEGEWQKHYSYIHEMNKIQAIQEKDIKIASLNKVIQEKGLETDNPNQVIQQKNQEILDLNQMMQKKDREIEQKNKKTVDLDHKLQQKDQEIELMKSSKFWKLREKYINLKNKLKI